MGFRLLVKDGAYLRVSGPGGVGRLRSIGGGLGAGGAEADLPLASHNSGLDCVLRGGREGRWGQGLVQQRPRGHGQRHGGNQHVVAVFF